MLSARNTYTRSSSPVFSIQDSPDSGEESAATVKLEVNKTPPRRMRLHSHGTVLPDSPQPQEAPDNEDDTQDIRDDGPENNQNVTSSVKPKKSRKHAKHREKVKFVIPLQRTIRHDRVDEKCRMLNIKYRRWPGTTEPKAMLHKSQCRFLANDDNFPAQQQIPGDCILCPTKKYLKDNWDARRHYIPKHQQNLLVMDDIVMLQCKCSMIRSSGWDRDHSTRNAHYHCSVCHWPRDKPSQIRNHIKVIHGRSMQEVQHLKGKQKK